jgi:hypothetical protein
MKLVIQMKTEDNLRELKTKVIEIFSQIPNRSLGIQDFSLSSNKSGTKKVELPYSKNANEVIVFNSVKNSNVLFILFTFEKEY